MNGFGQESTPRRSGTVPQVSPSSSNGGTSFEIINSSYPTSGSRTPGSMSYMNPIAFGQMSMTDITLEQALEKVQNLMKENKDLRDYLKENSEMMKQQFQALLDYKEKVKENNDKNKSKFQEIRSVVLELREENSQLKQQVLNAEKGTSSNSVTAKLEKSSDSMKRLTEDITAKDELIGQLREQLQQLTLQYGESKSETIYVAKTQEEDEKLQQMTKEKEEQTAVITDLNTQIQQLRRNLHEVNSDLHNEKRMKDEAQVDFSKMIEDNDVLTKRLENVLADMKANRQENKKLKSDILELECKLDEYRKNGAAGKVLVASGSKDGDKWDFATMGSRVDPSDVSVQTSYENVETEQLKKMMLQKEKQVEHLIGELNDKEVELQQFRDSQNRQNTPAGRDLHSLRSQNMSLMTEVTDTRAKLDSAKNNIDQKTQKISELEEALKRAQEEVMKQKGDDRLYQMRMSLNNHEQALNAERKEHQNTKKQMADLRQAFNSLMTDYKSVLQTFENYKQEQSHKPANEGEKSKLLSEISRLTAQILSAEESINYRDSQLAQMRKENERVMELHKEIDRLKDDVQTIPVLNAQADVWKADFEAERNAREAQHNENEKLKQEIHNLRLQNQQLMEESHNLSKEQFAEMQRKHAPSHQQQMRNQLQVARPAGNPYAPQFPSYQHIPQPAYSPDQQGLQDHQAARPNPGNEPYPQLQCPKCNIPCPDMDTLQIHVLECIDRN